MSLFKKILIVIPLIATAIVLVFAVRSFIPMHLGPVSDHFDGTRFFDEEMDHTFADVLKWWWEMETVEWPQWINDPPQATPVGHVDDGSVKVTYVNHATILIQMDGLNMLTDPIWSKRASPISWAGTKRVRDPGIQMNDLPRINVVLISHDHYDHLDLPTLKKLADRDQPRFFVGLGLKALLESEGIASVYEMDWWEEYQLKADIVKVIFVPARHNSGRSLFGNNKTLWGGFVVEGPSARVYFAGDTAYGRFLQAIKERFSEFDLALFPIGSYEKRWFMKTQHMNPDEAVKAHQLLNAKQSVGMHFGTFAEHPEQTIDAHVKDLEAALIKNNVPESEFQVLQFGEGRHVR